MAALVISAPLAGRGEGGAKLKLSNGEKLARIHLPLPLLLLYLSRPVSVFQQQRGKK